MTSDSCFLFISPNKKVSDSSYTDCIEKWQEGRLGLCLEGCCPKRDGRGRWGRGR